MWSLIENTIETPSGEKVGRPLASLWNLVYSSLENIVWGHFSLFVPTPKHSFSPRAQDTLPKDNSPLGFRSDREGDTDFLLDPWRKQTIITLLGRPRMCNSPSWKIFWREISLQDGGIGRDNYWSNIYVFDIFIDPLCYNPLISREQKWQIVSFMPSPALVVSMLWC